MFHLPLGRTSRPLVLVDVSEERETDGDTADESEGVGRPLFVPLCRRRRSCRRRLDRHVASRHDARSNGRRPRCWCHIANRLVLLLLVLLLQLLRLLLVMQLLLLLLLLRLLLVILLLMLVILLLLLMLVTLLLLLLLLLLVVLFPYVLTYILLFILLFL